MLNTLVNVQEMPAAASLLSPCCPPPLASQPLLPLPLVGNWNLRTFMTMMGRQTGMTSLGQRFLDGVWALTICCHRSCRAPASRPPALSFKFISSTIRKPPFIFMDLAAAVASSGGTATVCSWHRQRFLLRGIDCQPVLTSGQGHHAAGVGPGDQKAAGGCG